MLQKPQTIQIADEFRGALDPLIEQIGSPNGLAALAQTSGAVLPCRIANVADLRAFLEFYHKHILQPVELPAIQRAYGHVTRNELRELIAFDKEIADSPMLKNFATASRITGLNQLQRFRPMHDLRLAQRYLATVERAEANGWHTLVYGLMLTVYSLPLRQGLLNYAAQTTRGFIEAASRSFTLSTAGANQLFEELSLNFPPAVEPFLTPVAIA